MTLNLTLTLTLTLNSVLWRVSAQQTFGIADLRNSALLGRVTVCRQVNHVIVGI